MENNNNELYYTPNIEEFHVGFEYEAKVISENYSHYEFSDVPRVGINWGDLEGKYLNIIELLLLRKKIRVKYLDKEDIESLGFIYSSTRRQYELYHTDRQSRYEINENNNTYTISLCSLTKEIHIPYNLFIGLIKNKSELKKLLKQLEIKKYE